MKFEGFDPSTVLHCSWVTIHLFAGGEWSQTGNKGGATLRHFLRAELQNGED